MDENSYRRLLTPATLTAATYPPPGSWIPRTLPGSILFHRGYPFPEAIPAAEFAKCAQRLVAEEGDLPFHYSGSPSKFALESIITNRCRVQGVSAEGDQLVVTSGACQAIGLATTAFLSPGDTVAVEGPTYMETLEIFRNATPNIITYPVDADGLRTELLAADLADRRQHNRPIPKLVYTIPTNQNPTGTTLSLDRRQHLLALATEFDFLILEDAAYVELCWSPPPPAIKSLDQSGRVIYIGSYSKILAPGLRVGWALGPATVIRHMDLFKRDNDPAFAHAVAAQFLQRYDLEARVAWLTRCYQERSEFLSSQLREHLPFSCRWVQPNGGFFIWVELPATVDAVSLSQTALEEKVSVVASTHFFPLGSVESNRHVRFSFSYLPYDQMKDGVQRFARALSRHLN